MTPEGLIKQQIMAWLKAQPGCYARVLQIGGIRGRANQSKGMSDIIGIWKKSFLAIEVKTDKGVLSKEQQEFLDCVNACGGIGFVARSLDEVISKLNP